MKGEARAEDTTHCCTFPLAFRDNLRGFWEVRGWIPLPTASELQGDSPFPSCWPTAINQEINNLLPPSLKPQLPFPVESPVCLGTFQSGPPNGGPWRGSGARVGAEACALKCPGREGVPAALRKVSGLAGLSPVLVPIKVLHDALGTLPLKAKEP